MFFDDEVKKSFLELADLIKVGFSSEECDKELPKMLSVFEWLEKVKDIEVLENFLDDAFMCGEFKQGCLREDIVDDGDIVEDVLANAGMREYNYFKVPKALDKD